MGQDGGKAGEQTRGKTGAIQGKWGNMGVKTGARQEQDGGNMGVIWGQILQLHGQNRIIDTEYSCCKSTITVSLDPRLVCWHGVVAGTMPEKLLP